ncbi:MAG: putative 2-hydroxyacid dehydrogenase [Acidobacteria bacterium]|nr:putative 2-hydroxyacid dehydrogenase [Acidobacteriota bacterium]
MHSVLFINGQSKVIADIFFEKTPEGFDGSWKPFQLSHEEKAGLVRNVEFLVLHPAEISGSLLREARSLRLVQLLTAGYDKVDLAAAAELGIPVATNGGANAWGVAEQTVALLLALYRRLIQCDRSVREGKWRKAISGFDTFEVAEKTVGLIGVGNVGRKVAKRLKAFETRILYHDIVPAPDIEKDLGARRVSLDELLRESDILSIHVPLLRNTRNLVGERELSLMKPTAVLLNTSRGEIVDEAALVAALKEKRIAGAGLDVYHQEPISPENPLLKLENVILTPHTAGHTYEGWFRRSRFAWENIQRVASGQNPLSLARPEEG